MGKGKRRNKSKAKQRRRRRRRALPVVPAAVPTTVHDLPEELLCQVLLGLSSPLDLIRAAATCVRWRCAIAGDGEGFLGRFYDLHGAPCVAGHYYVTDSHPPDVTGVLRWPPRKPEEATFVPSSTEAVVVDAGLFSLDFLYVPPVIDRPPPTFYRRPRRTRIGHNQWREIVDSRGSLLLLTNGPWRESLHPSRWSPDFIVCEPLTRRYQGLARPADLSHLPLLGAFLLDGGSGAGGGDTMSNFRVLSVLYEPDRSRYQFGFPRACVFAPGSDGGWHIRWHTTDDDVEVPRVEMIHLAGRSAGRVYWGIEDGTVLVLDEITLKFSLLTFPAQMRGPYRRNSFRVIGTGVDGEDRVRVVRVHGEDLQVFGQLPDSSEWVMEKSIGLRDATAGLSGWEDYRFFRQPARIVTAGNTFVVLTPAEKIWLFSVELETMEVEKEHVRNRNIGPSYPCALPWPPLLKACVRRGDDDVVGKRGQRCHNKG